jgi:hypothetical protein
MRKITALILGVIICVGSINKSLQAQSVQILSSNALNGAINGIVLGGASMFLTDKKVNAPFNKNLDDLYALQVGLGLGTLYGVGMGAFDVVSGEGSDILVSGFFNDGNNSSIIVLMDTFYGAAGGGLIAMSLSLVSNDPIVDATKYGMGLGAFIGFGFGVIDTFIIAERSSEPVSMVYTIPQNADGLASISFDNGTSIGLINPTITTNLELTSTNFSKVYRPSVELINLRVNF